MQASVGISVRPWLMTTTSAVNSSVGSLSKWATVNMSPLLLTALHSSPHKTGTVSTLLWKGRRVASEKGLRDDVCGNIRAERVDFSRGEGRQIRRSWIQLNGGLQSGSWVDIAKEFLVPSARRGFLSELQSLRDEVDVGAGEPVEFESPLEIVLYPDPRLRNKNRRITVFDQKLQKLVQEMFEVMYKTDGVGLAAPQVGVNVQLMLYNPEGERGKGMEYILVNPKVVKSSKLRETAPEGCLSFLQLEADVERPSSVRVEAQDIKGKKFGISLKGWQARIFQHEYDHLEGVLYHDRMTLEEIDKIRPGLVQLEDDYEKRTGCPAPERVSR